jgi:hypothetical protein
VAIASAQEKSDTEQEKPETLKQDQAELAVHKKLEAALETEKPGFKRVRKCAFRMILFA